MEGSIFIHPSAIIDKGASIGANTKIWHFTHLMPGSTVGLNCNIGQNVFIDNEVTIGNGVKIQNNVSVYKGVEIEDDVFIGPSVVFTNVINPRSFIERKAEFKKTLVHRGATIGANATVLCGITSRRILFYWRRGSSYKGCKTFRHGLRQSRQAKRLVSKSGYPLSFNEKGEADLCRQFGSLSFKKRPGDFSAGDLV
jgi:UDP-2-acetamido-3-amino-2,3-dideoxy-glucuronate N-acetyltransferase